MTTLLTEAFKKASQLPESVQDQLASQILEEIESEIKWDRAFAQSQDELAQLADKALAEFEAGRTKEMGFDELCVPG